MLGFDGSCEESATTVRRDESGNVGVLHQSRRTNPEPLREKRCVCYWSAKEGLFGLMRSLKKHRGVGVEGQGDLVR